MFKRNYNDDIKKSLDIIKKERNKIKKIKSKKRKNIFSKKEKEDVRSLKEQIFSSIYFTIFGFICCLLILFIMAKGHNYIKLYFELNKFIDIYDTVTSNYYGKLDKNKMIDDAISSMLNNSTDVYTTYADKEKTNDFKENIEGAYSGIGCSVTMTDDGTIVIAEVFDGSPAARAGIQKDDAILKIDDIDYTNKTNADMSAYVKNNKNESIKVLLKRGDEEKEIVIKLSKVEMPTVSSKVYEKDGKKIGYINISVFSSVTYKQFKEELKKLEKEEKIEGLVIDVRENTGGYLGTVTDITSLFLKKGSIIYQLEDKKKNFVYKDKTDISRKYPVSVIINRNSASASEILASAIKESYNGDVVGINSFGKGTVQKTQTLSDGTMIKYTVQKWLTPKGNWINEIGVTPTYEVSYSFIDGDEVDSQLKKSLEVVSDKLK